MKLRYKIVVSILVLALLLLVLPWSDVREAWKEVTIGVWMSVFGGFMAGHCFGAIKWRMMLNISDARLSVVEGLRFYFAGLFANLCLPSIVGGDVLRAVLAGKATRRPEAVIIGSLVDRGVDVLSLALFVGASGLYVGRVLYAWDVNLIGVVLLLAGAGVALLIAVVARRPLAAWPARYRRRVGRGLVALRHLKTRPQEASLVLILSVIIQGTFVLLNAWVGYAVGIQVSLAVWFLVWPLAKLIGLVPISLAGFGVRDAALATLLLPFLVPGAKALAVSLVWDAVIIGGGLAGGFIWWLLRAPGERLGATT